MNRVVLNAGSAGILHYNDPTIAIVNERANPMMSSCFALASLAD